MERISREGGPVAARMDLTQLTQALSNTLHPELRAQAEAQLEQVRVKHAHPHALTTTLGVYHTGTQGARVHPLFVTSGAK